MCNDHKRTVTQEELDSFMEFIRQEDQRLDEASPEKYTAVESTDITLEEQE